MSSFALRLERAARYEARQQGRQRWLAFVDQAVSSLSNFLVVVLMARMLTPAAFGLGGSVFTAATFMIGVGRGFVGEPALTRLRAGQSRHPGAPIGAALAGGVILGGVLAASSLAFSSSERAALLIGAAAMPILLVQDALRFVFIACGRAGTACIGDATWVVALPIFFVAVDHTTAPSASSALAAFGLSCALALFVMLCLKRMPLRGLTPFGWLRKTRDLGGYYALDFVARSGGPSLAVLLVASLSGLAAAGGLRAGQSLYGPVRVLLWSASLAFVPSLRRRVLQGYSIRIVALRLSMLLAAGSAAIGVGLLALPRSLGVHLLGSTWSSTRPLLLPLAVATAAMAWTGGTAVAFRAFEAAKESMAMRVFQGFLTVPAAVAGSAADGARGAAWGLAVAAVTAAVLSEFQLRAVLRANDSSWKPDARGGRGASDETSLDWSALK